MTFLGKDLGLKKILSKFVITKITEKIARYLVLKGQKIFYDPLKTCFLDNSRGVSVKIFFESKILTKN